MSLRWTLTRTKWGRTLVLLFIFWLAVAFTATRNVYKILAAHEAGSPPPTGLEVACNGIDACISVHVFGFKRKTALETLLQTLEASDYTGYGKPLPLVVHLDGPATAGDWNLTAGMRQFVSNFEWTHGPKILDFKDANRGLKESWLKAWVDPKPNDIMLAFEDDVLPSRMYFQWLLKMLTELKLLRGDVVRDPNLLGVSLSPMRVDEITYPFRRWMTHENIPSKYPIFLHGTPSSWGVAYFGRPWREFLDFVKVRDSPQFYDVDEASLNLTGYGWHTKRGDPNLWLPDSRTNNWVKSWKRYMVEFAYGRGAYMLYPNLANSSGLATSTFEEGEHVPRGEFRNPRYAPLVQQQYLGLGSPFPSYRSLPLVDIHGEPTTRRDLSAQGDRFLRRISSLGEHYSTLARYWQRPCLLDSVDKDGSHGPEMRDRFNLLGNRYLMVAPQMGFSNQLIATVHSAVWAGVLERTLVLPFILWPRASATHIERDHWVPFHEIFDPSGILEHLPGLDFVYSDFTSMTEKQPTRLVAIEPEALFDQLRDDAYPQAFGWPSLPSADVVPHRALLSTGDSIYQHLGSCRDEVVFLNGLYKNPQTSEISAKQFQDLWSSLFKPTAMVDHVIRSFLQSFVRRQPAHAASKASSAYGCLHVRKGDFSKLCSASPDSAPWLAKFYGRGRRCDVSPTEIVEKANALNFDKLFVISDDSSFVASILPGIRAKTVLSNEDVRSFVERIVPPLRPNPTSELLQVVAAVAEQHICAQADRVVLNAFSTFSRSISFYRNKPEGIEYW
jgi:hypothetical protein